MLSTKVQSTLNKQVAAENEASHLYLSMASWCETEGYAGAAKFLYAHSEEEREHMMKLFKYINDAGGKAVVAPVTKIPTSYKSLLNVFETVLKHELEVTRSINAIVDLSLKEKDYSTFNFLQWFVAEQHEEERLFRSVLDLIKLTGQDGKGLFFADREIEKLLAAKT